MNAETDYTGTHKVVLPVDYLNSIDAVCDIYEERITEAAAGLDIPGLRLSTTQKLVRYLVATVCIWLIPAIWLTCL